MDLSGSTLEYLTRACVQVSKYFVTHDEIVWIANIFQKVWMSRNQSDGRAAGLAQVAQGNDDDCGVGQHRANVHSQLSLIIPD